MIQRRTPFVLGDPLLWWNDDSSHVIHIGTPAWYAWLTEATTFSFESTEGKFTARKEKVQRGGEYWKAYRRFRGKLLHSYLGKSEDMNFSRLNEVARLLSQRAGSLESATLVKEAKAPAQLHRIDWGEASNGGTFYGRGELLTQLEEWILVEGCRLINLLGMGGIGKTAVATQLVRNLQPSFDFIFWRSLLNAPLIEDILTEGITFLSGAQKADEASSLSKKIEYFLDALRTSRCLIVLDNVETVLQSDTQGRVGHYRPGFEAYGALLQLIGEAAHDSCLVLTSREKPKEVGLLEGKHSPVRSLLLPPLEEEACKYVLHLRALVGPEEAWKTLIRYYAGNPLALKLVAGTIEEVFGRSILTFFQQGGGLLGDIRELLDQQFERLTSMERSLLYWLAIEREAITSEDLLANVVTSDSKDMLLDALNYLVQRRCWIEKDESRTTFTLQPVIMQYVTDLLIAQVYEEIATESMRVFLSHALVKAQAKEEVRNSQIRLILEPLADKLLSTFGKQGVEKKVMSILFALRTRYPQTPGYAGGNILHLLRLLKSDLRHMDFSGLTIRQAYLRGMNLRDVNFSRCDFAHSVFTQTFGNVIAVAFSPDGKHLAVGTTDGETCVWHVPDGKLLLVCEGHANSVMSVAFSVDGKILASGGCDQTIKLWDVQTGQCLRTLCSHIGWVRTIAFHPDGTLLASGSDDHTIRLWSLSTGQCLSILHGHNGWVRTVAFHPDGTLLASGSDDSTIQLWNLYSDQPFKTLHDEAGTVVSVAFSAEGRVLASGGSDHTVKLWDVQTGQCLKILQGHTSVVRSVAFHPISPLLVSSSDDRYAKLWSIETEENLRTLRGHTGPIWSVSFSPDGKLLASGGYDQNIKLWEVDAGEREHCLNNLQGYRDDVWSVAFSPDGKTLASSGNDQGIKLWDVQSGRCRKQLQGHSDLIRSVALSPDGKTLASGSYDQSVKLWDVQTGNCLSTLHGHSNYVSSVAFSPNGKLLASGSYDQSIKVWDVQTGNCLSTLHGHSGRIWSVAFSPDGKTLASSGNDQGIKLWDVQSGRCRKQLQGHSDLIRSVALSPDGKTLASGSYDQSVKLWDVQTGNCLSTLHGHSNYVLSVAFSPDATLLASGSEDQSVKLWDAQTGTSLSTLHGHSNAVRTVAFSPTGTLLVSGSQDETLKLWDMRTWQCVSTLRAERPYERLNISGVTGLTEAEKASIRALGAREQKVIACETMRSSEYQRQLEPLSERELQVLQLAARGASTKEIAQQLVVTTSTVKTHLKGIYKKLDVHSRAQAVARSNQLKIL